MEFVVGDGYRPHPPETPPTEERMNASKTP
jgi:hypothetical protein